MPPDTDLLGISDIARLAGVNRSVVANWRTRYPDFPSPAAEPTAGPVFRRQDVADWLELRRPGKLRISPLGFEAQLWQAADLLRNNVDPAEYKHVVLGLVFLKYISDTFEERRDQMDKAAGTPGSDYYCETAEDRRSILEDRDEYTAQGVFWVPLNARWSFIRDSAKQSLIGKLIDDAMVAIERDNPRLKNVLPKDYARPTLDWHTLGQLIDLISGIGLGGSDARAKDVLGRVYEYFLGRFASAEGKGGGEFYTPMPVVRILVEMLEPFTGRVYDPCCGSGGMFVQSVRFTEAHGGKRHQISIYGQESNPTTWRLCQMNLAIRGIECNPGAEPADSFRRDLHPDLRADYILANPPFNVSDWKGDQLRDDVRWRFGVPSTGNANFAWVQHFIHHLSPRGVAGFVLANGSLSSQQSGEGQIRKSIVEADLVDCIVALPTQLFYTTPIPVCLWFVARDKRNSGFRDRSGRTLFIDASRMGSLVSRIHRVLSDDEIDSIARTYHAWRGEPDNPPYVDEPGFCREATLDEICAADFVLAPSRYVGSSALAETTVTADAVEGMFQQLSDQLGKGEELDVTLRHRIETLLSKGSFE